MPSASGATATERGEHLVHFYLSDDELVDHVEGHFLPALQLGGNALLVATPAHRLALEQRLVAAGIDLDRARDDGSYLAFDAEELLGRFMVRGRPDERAFEQTVGATVAQARSRAGELVVFGEMVALLWDEGNIDAALALEALWNGLGERLEFSLLCAYPVESVQGRAHDRPRAQVCRLHSAVVGFPDRAVARRFPYSEDAPRQARQFVHQAMAHASGAVIDDALLVVSELATNAVIHAATDFTVRLVPDGELLRIEVSDTSPVTPTERRLPWVEPSGRGLGLVSSLSRRWGFESAEGGKTIWAELAR